MAVTSYGVNDNLAVKLWAKKLFAESLKQTSYAELMGTGSDSVIQVRGEMNKSEGDRLRIGLRMQLSGAGVQGDGTLEGNEEALTTYYDDLFIDQLRHAVRSAGKMSEQRVPFSVRDEARKGLQDWWADRMDTWFFNQLGGYTAQTDTRYTGNQATVAPDSDHFDWASVDHTTDATIDSSDTFDIKAVDACIEKAKTLSPAIRPAKIKGKQLYVMFLHPYQVYDLRTSITTGQWLDIQKANLMGGKDDSPIFSGALGIYNGTLLLENSRVPYGVNASTSAAITTVRRAIFMGAQAGLFGYGQKNGSTEMSWVEELFDYENQLGVSAGMIAGLKKTRFNSKDFGTIVVSSYAAAH